MRLPASIALALLAAAATPARADDEFAQHCERASALSQNDQYADALKELELAYAIKQPPSLLYALGRAHRKLGNAKQALDYYQRFLIAENDPNPDMKRDVESEVAHLRQLLHADAPPARERERDYERAPLANPYAMNLNLVPVRYETRRDRGLIGGGIALMATAYAGAVIAGSLFLSSSNCCGGPSGAASGVLLIPVIGPVLSGLLFLSAAWSLPWVLIDAAAQTAGLAMIIVGARSVTKTPIYSERFKVMPFATVGGGGFLVSGRF